LVVCTKWRRVAYCAGSSWQGTYVQKGDDTKEKETPRTDSSTHRRSSAIRHGVVETSCFAAWPIHLVRSKRTTSRRHEVSALETDRWRSSTGVRRPGLGPAQAMPRLRADLLRAEPLPALLGRKPSGFDYARLLAHCAVTEIKLVWLPIFLRTPLKSHLLT
jgi:hypothetical protein